MLEINIPNFMARIRDLKWLDGEMLERISTLSSLELYDAREEVFHGSQQGERMYVIISGSLHVLKCVPNGEVLVNILYENDEFGAQFIFGQVLPHETIVVAPTQTLLASFPVADIIGIIRGNESCAHHFEILSGYYPAYDFVRTSTIFGDTLSPHFLIEFVSAFDRRCYHSGDYVMRAGDDPDGYYICLSGQLKVLISQDGKDIPVGVIRSGDYFGELALTTSTKRAASIIATAETECFFLSKSNFEKLVEEEPKLLDGFNSMAKLAYKK
ncbi:MAG: cyclic nucleotide-binding domain-containing protein [Planctomycetes bacterium]|nr:cyclic nucleotide-binding domain-containing protein [Planctomycetota bacterium]